VCVNWTTWTRGKKESILLLRQNEELWWAAVGSWCSYASVQCEGTKEVVQWSGLRSWRTKTIIDSY